MALCVGSQGMRVLYAGRTLLTCETFVAFLLSNDSLATPFLVAGYVMFQAFAEHAIACMNLV